MKTNLKSIAYHVLKERLIHCHYVPGSILKESELAEELKISRTPVREAISLLEIEGYLVIVPKKGILVTDITLNDVMQIFQVRMAIEPLTLKMAGPNLRVEELMDWLKKFQTATSTDIQNSFELDTQMHLFLIEHCHNKYIIDMMKTVFDKNTRIIISSKHNIAHVKDARQEHCEILTSLVNQDFELAADQMGKHLANCRKAAIDYFYCL